MATINLINTTKEDIKRIMCLVISQRLGVRNWTSKQLIGRLTQVHCKLEKLIVYYLDNQKMMILHPVTTHYTDGAFQLSQSIEVFETVKT